ncbi:MAG: hypothetical protein ACFFCQ_04235, partial [Promethearchaeota archaeon]
MPAIDGKTNRKKQPYAGYTSNQFNRTLERKIRALETEKQLLDAERIRLERELNSVRTELERLRTPPLFAGTLQEVFEDGRAIVKSSTGPSFIVQVSGNIPMHMLKSGTRVALN